MKNINIAIISGILSLVLFTGCKEQDVITHRLRISHHSLSFDAVGNQSYTIDVESFPVVWDMEASDDWIISTDKTVASITLTAKANESTDERFGKLTLTNGELVEEISIHQMGANLPAASKFRLLPEFSSFEISPQGKMGLGVIMTADDSDNIVSTPYIIEIATDKRTQLPSIDGEFKSGVISDDGSIVIINGVMSDIARQYVTDQWVVVDTPQSANVSFVSSMSADGSIWVGYIDYPGNGAPEKLSRPVKWVNGVLEEVLSAPEVNLWGDPMTSGSQARGCSSDGSVIYGTQWDNFAPIYWKDGSSWEYVASDLQKIESITTTGILGPRTSEELWTPWLQANVHVLSDNGKYIATTYNKIVSIDNARVVQDIPMLTDLETGESILLEDITNGRGRTVTDEGLFFYITPAGSPDTEMVYDIATGTSIPVIEWVKNTYGITITGVCLINDISMGGSTIVGERRQQSALGAVAIPFYITTEGI
jgi:hypothetical protein